MQNEVILKRALFGGFDRKQVMEYIAYLHSKSNAVKEELTELSDLKSMVSELEAEISEKDNMITRLHSAVSDAENNTRLSSASNEIMEQAVEFSKSYIKGANALVQDVGDKTKACVKDAQKKIDVIISCIGEISDTVVELYASMDDLKSEYQTFGEIYPNVNLDNIGSESEIVSETVEASPVETYASEPEEIGEDDTIPTEEAMMEFLRRMEAKYKGLITS